jgi:hypothetical protein
MFFAKSYIEQKISNPFYSEFLYLHSAAGGLGQIINVTFQNENVELIFITNLLLDSAVSPIPPFILSDQFIRPIINFTGISGLASQGTFLMFNQGETLLIQSNNINVGFIIQFQKVYSSQKLFKKTE